MVYWLTNKHPSYHIKKKIYEKIYATKNYETCQSKESLCNEQFTLAYFLDFIRNWNF